MKKVGMLERATIMGGESLLLPNIVDYFEVVNKYVNTICLVTNGTKLTEELTKALVENGLEEMAISISSKEQYKARREQILIAKSTCLIYASIFQNLGSLLGKSYMNLLI